MRDHRVRRVHKVHKVHRVHKVHKVRRVHRVLWFAAVLLAASTASAQVGQWHSLPVPGGRATLRSLGVADDRERSAAMIEIIRRLQFSTKRSPQLDAAIRSIPVAPAGALTLPSPLAHASWERVLGRSVAPPALMRAILSDVPARLLFHGLAGVDAESRAWFEGEIDLLRAIYRDADAVKAFAMFAPAIEVAGGRVVVAGGAIGEARWLAAAGASAADPRRFVQRLFLDRAGRGAGLYALATFVEEPRRRFVLHADSANGGERFASLVSSFSSCYPKESNDYPFALRSNDPALLLLGARVAPDGTLRGPRSAAFWDRVFDAGDLVPRPFAAGGREVDAAALVQRLCSSPTRDRAAVFGTLLAGQRVFEQAQEDDLADAIVALRVRRRFPAMFMAMERAGVREPATFAAAGRQAAQLDRLDDGQNTAVALQQFQGALAMALRARAAGTLNPDQLSRLLSSLAEVLLIGGRYDGRLATWLERELLPALGFGEDNVVEFTVAGALAGPAVPPVRVAWEGLDYLVDYAASTRDRLMAVRPKQGGETLDRALDLARGARTPAEVQAADMMLGEVLASWAYAPHVGGPDSGALVGGDGSRRHDLGLRDINRTRFEQRWTLAVTPGDRGAVAGSYLGLEAALAGWSLRRLSADSIPPEPTLGDNDRMSLFAMVSLSEYARLDDAALRRIAAAIEEGERRVAAAGSDVSRLEDLARSAAISPWRRAALRWMLAEEPARISGQFSLSGLATIGGLSASQIPAWGTSSIPAGCLCLAAPMEGMPELVAGRPADGIVGARSGDLQLRVAQLLTELQMPARLAPAVLAYAMRDYIDRLRPAHPADADAFARAALSITRTMVEDYLGAIAAVGPLRPVQ